MKNAIIVHEGNNESLLRFTQTKLFFDAKNIGIDFFKGCITLESYENALNIAEPGDVILETGDFLTTTFRSRYDDSIITFAKDSEDIIKFDKNIPIDFKKRYYPKESKQLYIIENLLKTVLRSKKLIYLDNNEHNSIIKPKGNHLYGLASGWKTAIYSSMHNFKTVTVYDYCNDQLNFAKYLHSLSELPETVNLTGPTSGIYNPPKDIKEYWNKWHNMNVKFEKLNLLDNPVFPKNSFIWISNVFNYEPTLFEYGFERIVIARNYLLNNNKDSIITI